MNDPWHELVPPKFRAILRSLITLSPHHLAAEIPLQRQIISSRLFAHWKTTNTRHIWSPTANQPNLSDAFCDLETRHQNPCNRFTFQRFCGVDSMMIHYNFIYFLMLQTRKKHEKKLEHDGFFPCRSRWSFQLRIGDFCLMELQVLRLFPHKHMLTVSAKVVVPGSNIWQPKDHKTPQKSMKTLFCLRWAMATMRSRRLRKAHNWASLLLLLLLPRWASLNWHQDVFEFVKPGTFQNSWDVWKIHPCKWIWPFWFQTCQAGTELKLIWGSNFFGMSCSQKTGPLASGNTNCKQL